MAKIRSASVRKLVLTALLAALAIGAVVGLTGTDDALAAPPCSACDYRYDLCYANCASGCGGNPSCLAACDASCWASVQNCYNHCI